MGGTAIRRDLAIQELVMIPSRAQYVRTDGTILAPRTMGRPTRNFRGWK